MANRTSTPDSLGKFIRSHRQNLGWSLDNAAAASGLDATYWSKVERSTIKKPDAGNLAQMAAVLDVPLADLYGLAGYTAPQGLPTFRGYLRSKYHLPPEAITQLEGYFGFLRSQYGIPEGEAVFPPKPRQPRKPGPKAQPRPTGGPWDDPAVAGDRKAA
ncbi:MAG: hypothetical protein QOK43_1968 [Acidimicrobiaceae bacterium]|nr:hypothetical protein [Acidimicrobiaceae bacterium]